MEEKRCLESSLSLMLLLIIMVLFCSRNMTVVLATLGYGGTRSTLSTIGADQLVDKPKDQWIFFNWFYFFWYSTCLVASIAIVYVEDNVNRKAEFFICVACNVAYLVIFLMGSRFYVNFKPEGSPFTSFVHVVVASIRKRQVSLLSIDEDFYQGHNVVPKPLAVLPLKTFRKRNLGGR